MGRLDRFREHHPKVTLVTGGLMLVVSVSGQIWTFATGVLAWLRDALSSVAASLGASPPPDWSGIWSSVWTVGSPALALSGFVLILIAFLDLRRRPTPTPLKPGPYEVPERASAVKAVPSQVPAPGRLAPALGAVPPDMRPAFVQEIQRTQAGLLKTGSDMGIQIWRLPTTVTSAQEHQWRPQVDRWQRDLARFEQKWASTETVLKEIADVAPRLVVTELAQTPPPPWRAELISRLRAGNRWLERHGVDDWEPSQ